MKNKTPQAIANTYASATTFVKIIAGISLILAPFLSFIGWAIAHDSLKSFFTLNFYRTVTDATAKLTASSDPALLFRYYLFPHYFIFVSMLFYIGLAIGLSYILYKKAPWHSFIGAILSTVGAVYFVAILGAYLTVPMGKVVMTDIIKVSFALSALVFIGNLIQGFGLYQSKLIPKWGSLLFLAGNILILAFPGVENWMALGSFMMVLAVLPLSKLLFIKSTYMEENLLYKNLCLVYNKVFAREPARCHSSHAHKFN